MIDTFTVITLPVLSVLSSNFFFSHALSDEVFRLLVKFRTWLDGARLLLLLTCHIGMAASFVIWIPTISCPDDSESSCYLNSVFQLTDIQAPDDRGVCQLLNVLIAIASWVPPFLREHTTFKCSS